MARIVKEPGSSHRDFRTEQLDTDLVVVGGGMAGTCCAITAARAGARVVLIQDRPVLGGNASSEVRLWIQSANAHGRTNNRWAREGGVLDEILVENTYRNPQGNPIIFDTVLLEKLVEEQNITLLLNTTVNEATKQGNRISSIRAFCGQNQTVYDVQAPLFCDSSGDGVLGYLSGAAFRMGAETKGEFGELFAPSEEYGTLLPHSLFFYTKDAGRRVEFIPPSYALDDISKIPRYRHFNTDEHGTMLWWLDHGGRLDTIHDTERIKWELWEIVYGVWNHLKNSGEFPSAENITLEWVGLISGKRESRRFEGHYMLRQQDIVQQAEHEDAVAYGGWAIDLHPADGVFSEHPAANLLWSRGIYQIPYRCLISQTVPNLFLGGRLISASHVAFSSTRVMATCAHMGQAVGMAAAICARDSLEPARLIDPDRMHELQTELLKTGQHIPGVPLEDPADLAHHAEISASSEFVLGELPADGPPVSLDRSRAQLLPLPAGRLPQVTFTVDVSAPTVLRAEVRTGDRPDNYTPDVVIGACEIELGSGDSQQIKIDVDGELDQARYAFFCLMQNDQVAVHTSSRRVTGLMSVRHGLTQEADDAIGRPRLELWSPERNPSGQNLAIVVEPPLRPYIANNIRNGYTRPTSHPNAWVAAPDDPSPSLVLRWPERKRIREVTLAFDTDFNHPLESVLMTHSDNVSPFCMHRYRLRAGDRVIAERDHNHQTRNRHHFEPPLETDQLVVDRIESYGDVPAAVFGLHCYE